MGCTQKNSGKIDGMGTYTKKTYSISCYSDVDIYIYIYYILVYIQNLSSHFFSFVRLSKIGHDFNGCLVVVFSGANGPPL